VCGGKCGGVMGWERLPGASLTRKLLQINDKATYTRNPQRHSCLKWCIRYKSTSSSVAQQKRGGVRLQASHPFKLTTAIPFHRRAPP
jgi:hypothetical protein